MLLKSLLGILFAAFLLGSFVLRPLCACGPDVEKEDGAAHLRLLTWNIGNGDLESDSRAHTEDLKAVAKTIKDKSADVVALQELAGKDQLKLLLKQLDGTYDGYLSSSDGDRFDAVLVRKLGKNKPVFSDVGAGGRFAAAASFSPGKDLPEISVVSAHADAFSAERRRRFVGDVVDWSRIHSKNGMTFIAGDFNLEVNTRTRNNLFTNNAHHDSESYSYLLKYFRDLGLNAGDTAVNERRIDYIFGPPTGVRLHTVEVLRDASVGQMDHWPLLVDVSF
jgi:endonuclease/exonuclease/phosphatase family metal-dependent hydrolase